MVPIVLQQGGSQDETLAWARLFWTNYFLRGSVIWDPNGSTYPAYWQPDTDLPFGRGFIIDQQGNVALPFFGHQADRAIETIYELLGEGPGYGYCFGDPGSGTPCPCNNENDGTVPGSGCANGVFTSGAKLVGSGEASVSSDTLVLSTRGLEPNNTGLYFQANNRTNGGDGNVFGDGLRCAGGGLIRLQIRTSDSAGESQTTIGIAAKGGVSPGETKRYQCWYRTIQSPPCGAGAYDFNLSNGYQVVWTP